MASKEHDRVLLETKERMKAEDFDKKEKKEIESALSDAETAFDGRAKAED